jgi:serine/threonine-protein kinase
MSPDAADRNLLFGVFALQADLIDPVRFAEACAAWAGRKNVALGELLVERGWITLDDRADLERLIDRRVKKHNGDVRASLAGLVTTATRQALAGVPDPDLRQSLDGLPPSPAGHVLLSTVAYQPEGRGRYTVTHLHARGGVGQVWVAEDGDLGRAVALKEVRPDRATSAEVFSRFLEEARITGQLEHPGIVPVYELVKGGAAGQPFYTMRLVRGRTLTQAGDAYHRRRAAGEATRLELRELLGAFVAVCNAIAYAHSRGVIHRDLKGSNVVLGDFGEVMVLDWGLAKVIGTTSESRAPVVGGEAGQHGETQQGQVIGTPAYMPPEQAEGRLAAVDERSDVYGLGAILYEILTGRPPFDGTDSHQILQRVIHDGPDRPRRLVPGTPAALEAVCLHALAKEPAERYPSPAALADEVRHWLAGEPVTAYREPLLVRGRRWMGRHRTLVTATAAALVVAVVCLAAATGLLARANRETREARDLALGLKHEAEGQRDQARTNFQLARDTVEEYTTKVANDPRLKEKDLEDLRKGLLRSATKFFDKLTQQAGDDPAVRADLGRAHRDLGFLAKSTGDYKAAVEHGEQALAIFERLNAEHPDDVGTTRELAKTCAEFALILGQIGQWDRTVEMYRRSVRLLEETRGQPDPDLVGRKYLAQAYRYLGEYLADHDSPLEDLTATYERAVALHEELVAASPGDPDRLAELGCAYCDLGWRYAETGNPRRGREYLDKSVRMLRGILDKQPDDAYAQNNLACTYHSIARLESEIEDRAAAIAAFDKAVQIHTRLIAAHPGVTMYQQCLARDLNNLATVHVHFGEREQAVAVFGRARVIKEKLAARYNDVPEYKADLARTIQNLSQFVEPREAEELLRRGREIDLALVAQYPDAPLYLSDLASNCTIRGSQRDRAGKWDEAEADLAESVRILTEVVAKNPAKVEFRLHLADAHGNLAGLHTRRKQLDRAEADWRAALAVHEELAARHPDNLRRQVEAARALYLLADCLHLRRHTDASADLYQQAIIKLRAAVEQAPTNVMALADLSDAYIRLAGQQAGEKQIDLAVENCLVAVEMRRRLTDAYPEAPKYRSSLSLSEQELGQLLGEAQRFDEAAQAYGRAFELQQKLVAAHPGVDTYENGLARIHSGLGRLHARRNEPDLAIAELQKERALLLALVGRRPEETAYRASLAGCALNLGIQLARSGRLPEALASMREAAAMLDQLPPAMPFVTTTRTGLARSLALLGRDLAARNRDEATEAFRLGIEQHRQLAATGASESARRDLALALTNLARHLGGRARFEEADSHFREGLTLLEQLAREHPDSDDHALHRAATHGDWGGMENRRLRYDEALKRLDAAVALLQPMIESGKNAQATTRARNMMRIVQGSRGHALLRLKRPAEAVAAYDKSLELAGETNQAGPRLKRAIALAQTGDHARAVADAEGVAAKDARPGELYDAACVLSLASAAAAQDKRLLEAERTRLADAHAARAVVLLRQAQKAGYFKTAASIDYMKKDSDLDPLRSNADYRKLLAEMEAPAKAVP